MSIIQQKGRLTNGAFKAFEDGFEEVCSKLEDMTTVSALAETKKNSKNEWTNNRKKLSF